MADQKISELTNITGANLANADEFVVVDTSADQTKAVTRAEFFKNTPSIDVTGTVTADNVVTTGTLSSSKAVGYGAVEVGGPSGGLIDLKAPFSDDYDARIIYNAGADLQIITLADEPILLRQGNATKLQTTSTGVNVTGTVTADGLTVDGTTELNGNTIVNDGWLKVQGSSGSIYFIDTDVSAQSRIWQTGENLYIDNQSILGGDTYFRTDNGKIRQIIRDNGDISFRNTAGTADSLHWDAADESLGIGTTSPSAALDVVGDANVSGIITAGGPSDNFPSDNTTGSGTALNPNGRISTLCSNNAGLNVGRHSGTGTVAQWYYAGPVVGSVSVTASATAYNTSSDYRLKENIEPVQGAADIVKAMRPVTYTFKSDGSWHDGFLAHELQELHPRAVIGEKDAMIDEEYEVTPAVYEDVIIPAVDALAEVPAVYDDEGSLVSEVVPAVEAQPERTEQRLVSEAVMGTRSVPDYQGVDYSKLTPILTAALQEALNKIDALETRLTALEG